MVSPGRQVGTAVWKVGGSAGMPMPDVRATVRPYLDEETPPRRLLVTTTGVSAQYE
jgi:hypothetical protein